MVRDWHADMLDLKKDIRWQGVQRYKGNKGCNDKARYRGEATMSTICATAVAPGEAYHVVVTHRVERQCIGGHPTVSGEAAVMLCGLPLSWCSWPMQCWGVGGATGIICCSLAGISVLQECKIRVMCLWPVYGLLWKICQECECAAGLVVTCVRTWRSSDRFARCQSRSTSIMLAATTAVFTSAWSSSICVCKALVWQWRGQTSENMDTPDDEALHCWRWGFCLWSPLPRLNASSFAPWKVFNNSDTHKLSSELAWRLPLAFCRCSSFQSPHHCFLISIVKVCHLSPCVIVPLLLQLLRFIKHLHS